MENKFDNDIFEVIFNHSPFYYFLINTKVQVELTNYFKLNTKAEVSVVDILGNVLNCKNACDAGRCGGSEFCKSCMIRASIVRAFEKKRNFRDMESSMTLYDKNGMPYSIDVSVSGTIIEYKGEQKMLVCVRDITLYKSVQRRLLSLEYQGNFMKRKAGIMQRLAKTSNEKELKEELVKILDYTGDLQEHMKSLRDSLNIDTYSLLPTIEIICNDDAQFKILKRYLKNRYQIYRGTSIEDDIFVFLNSRVDAVIVAPDIEFQEANLFVSAIRSTVQNVPILRLLNQGDSIAGDYTMILYNPITPRALDEVLKNVQIASEIKIK